jgi:ornithine cyclodeaminase
MPTQDPRVIEREQIEAVLPALDLASEIEAAFAAYSQGRAVVPPVGELLLEDGEVHIKYGCLREGAFYVIKVASGFYNNSALGLPSTHGLMLLFDQKTGQLASILLDRGLLTEVRTAVAGAIVAAHLAPRDVERIGIVGTGAQARLQLEYLKPATDCRRVLVWGRDDDKLARYRDDMEPHGFTVETTRNASDVLQRCNLVVTATPATTPLLLARDLQRGTHITAMGSDTAYKHELEAPILGAADVVVADSISQCLERGEIHKALQSGDLDRERVIELGNVVSGSVPGRTTADQITVADLTGVAVQDIAIANAVHRACRA